MSKRITNVVLSQEELARIRERSEKATEGPWNYSERHGYLSPITPQPHVANICNEITRDGDAVFIAHAREDIPKLLAEIERLRKHIQARQENCIICGEYFYVNFHGNGSLYFCEECGGDDE